MQKDYLVTVIESHRKTYRVPAKSQEEARNKIENADRTYDEVYGEYNDLERVEGVEEEL